MLFFLAASGYMLHLRQADDRPDSAAIMRHFISIVNNRNGAPAAQSSSGGGSFTPALYAHARGPLQWL